MNLNSVGNKDVSISSYIVVSPDLCHGILGHVNYSSLKNMMDLDLTSNVDFNPIHVKFLFNLNSLENLSKY